MYFDIFILNISEKKNDIVGILYLFMYGIKCLGF